MPESDAALMHLPVMPSEVLAVLDVNRGGVYVDCTLGLGGHAEAILSASDSAQVIGIDQDDAALRLAAERLARFSDRARLVKANFSAIQDVVDAPVDGILADLGVSSLQLDSETRGF